jgi:hypothetical protein
MIRLEPLRSFPMTAAAQAVRWCAANAALNLDYSSVSVASLKTASFERARLQRLLKNEPK